MGGDQQDVEEPRHTEADAFAALDRYVGRVRRWLELHALLTGATVALIGAGAVVGVGTSLVLLVGPEPALRLATAVTAALVGLAALLFCLARPLGRHRGRLRMARYVEERVPGLRNGLRTALELHPRRAALPADGRTSPSLLQALAERTVERLAPIEPRQLVPMGRVAGLAAVLFVLVAGMVAAGFLHGDLLRGGMGQLLAGADPVVPQNVRAEGPVEMPVVVGDLALHYEYPDYTGRPDRQELNVTGDIRALAGTRVALRTRSLVAAQEAEIRLASRPDEPVALTVGPDGSLEGELTLRENDAYHFQLTKPDGTMVVESGTHSIEVRPDASPHIRLLLPESDLEVNADDKIELLFHATDDFGVEEVTLAYERAGPESVPVRRRSGTESHLPDGQGRALLDLKALELGPGEQVTVWMEATDGDTVTGPKTSRSESRVIRIYSPDEKHVALLAEEREIFEVLLLRLAERLVLPKPRQVPVDAPERVLEETTATVRTMDAAMDALEGLIGRMGEDPLTPEDVLRDFAEIHSRLSVLLEEETTLLRHTLQLTGAARHAPARQRALAKHNAETVPELEQAVLLIDRLVDRQHQERVLGEGKELVRQTDRLLEMMAELEKTGDEALRLRMARELERMKQSLDQMARDLHRQAKSLPHDRFNQSALGDRGTTQSLRSFRREIAEIQQLLADGKMDEARRRLEELASSSQNMMASLEGDFAERGSVRMARNARQVRRARRRLDRIAGAQQELHDATGEQDEMYRERVQQKLRGRMERLAEREEFRIARLERRLRTVRREALHPDDRETLDQRFHELEDVRRLLAEGDVGQASKVADRVERSVRALRQEVGQGAMLAPDRARQQELRKQARRLGSAEPPADDLARSLRSLLPEPTELLDPREQQRMERMSRQQDTLRERLQRARRGMRRLGEDQPGLHGQLERILDQAESSMEKAGERLGELDPSMAEEHQRSALERLAEAGEQLDRASRPDQKKGEGVGVDDHRKPVEIPQAADYQVPEAFRAELLRAMREDSPASYRKLIEAYYEALIR